MAINDLGDFTKQGLVGGLLMVCLLTFAITFMAQNNTDGFGDTGDVFDTSFAVQEATLLESPQSADTLLNITSNTNPEVSDLGSRDSVATSFEAVGSAKQTFENSKQLIAWVFTGDTGKVLLTTLGAIIGFLSVFFIVKFIKQGS